MALRWLDWYGDGSLYVYEIGLACCALEFDAATMAVPALPGTAPRDAAAAVVVSGTVTDRLAPTVLALIEACSADGRPRPWLVSLGACASSGGPYWDSYAVTKGIDQLVEVDVYVPGCPPPPDALLGVLAGLRSRQPA